MWLSFSAQLEKIYNDMFERVKKLEEEKYDINFIVTQTEAEINELTIAVNDLRGKLWVIGKLVQIDEPPMMVYHRRGVYHHEEK